MYIKFENEAVPSLDFADIEAKYGGQSSKRLAGEAAPSITSAQGADGRSAGQAGRGSSTDLDYSRQVVGEVEDLLARQDLKRYGPNFKVQLTGTYKKKIDQQAQIARDLSWRPPWPWCCCWATCCCTFAASSRWASTWCRC